MLSWDGKFNEVEVWVGRSKWRKSEKSKGGAPNFGVCVTVLVVERKGCTAFGYSKVIVCGRDN